MATFDLLGRIRMRNDITSPMKSAVSSVMKLTAAIGGVALAYKAVDVAMNSVKKAMSFESQLSSIQALTGASSKEMAKMSALALKMGADTKYNALQAAEGIEELLKAGLTPAAVQAGGLEAALNLATAGGLELASAAEIMSTALNAYKKDGMSAAEASNILAGTANASATGVEDLRQSLAAVSAVAAGVGFTFKDTNIALGLFANNGLKGSDAGTSLKTMMQRLQPTTKQQTKLFKALGLVTKNGANEFYDAHGNIKSLQSISGSLRKSLGKLTNQQRALALETMFGSDAVRAANILFNEGADGVKKFQAEMSKVTALDVAKKKMDNAAGAVEQFQGAIETLQISALLPTMPLIKQFANKAADMVVQYTPQITAAMQRMTDKASQYLNSHFTNNADFQKITTLEGKIKFVYEDVMKSFNDWLNGGGRDKISQMAENVVNFIANSLKASAPLIEAAANIGTAIGKGMLDGLVTFSRNNPELAAVMAFAATRGPVQVKAGVALATVAAPTVMDTVKTFKDPTKSFGSKLWDFVGGGTSGLINGSNASGLDRVPYDGYVSRLHKDETVLTRTEAAAYRDGNGGKGGVNVTVTGNTFHVRNDSDIDAIAGKLAALLAQ